MGYTHYIDTDKWSKEDSTGFEKSLPIVRKILKKYKDLVQFECGIAKRPQVSKEQIRFNGIGDDGHETFVVHNRKKQSSFLHSRAYCKTARKPYDLPICEILLVLKANCPNLKVDSDGFSGCISNAVLDESWPAAIENVKEYGFVYRTGIVRKRAPYCDMMPVLSKPGDQCQDTVYTLRIKWEKASDLSEEDAETLRNEGLERARDMSLLGYVSGEFYSSIGDVEYWGWWEWECKDGGNGGSAHRMIVSKT
jgi:hypothetical protein